MLNILDRVFTHDLQIGATHTLIQIIPIVDRLTAHIYLDDPYYLTIFHLGNRPVLKEVMVSDLWSYQRTTAHDRRLHEFIFDYADAQFGGR